MGSKNYYFNSIKEIEKIKETGTKPSLLLHACCGPCSGYPLEFLTPYFDLTIYFNNSNIYPREEYFRRLSELKRFVSIFNYEHQCNVKIIETRYLNDLFNENLEPYRDLPEGQERCFICFRLRMDEAFRYAEKNHFDYFTTVMTISRQKNSQKLNEIGIELQEKYHYTKYFISDFKKNKGIDRAVEIRKKYNMYQQLYCGCKYTFQKLMLKKSEEKN